MESNVQNENKECKNKLRINTNLRYRNKILKKDILHHIKNYLRAPENTHLDILFERALENIKRKNGDI